MQIDLNIEQSNNLFTAMLMDDYSKLVQGYFSEDCMQYKESFEKLMEFYLTPNQRKELLTYNVG